MTHTSDHTSRQSSDHHCTVIEQKHLVSEMTRCDQTHNNSHNVYECYVKATQKSRENNACMYS